MNWQDADIRHNRDALAIDGVSHMEFRVAGLVFAVPVIFCSLLALPMANSYGHCVGVSIVR